MSKYSTSQEIQKHLDTIYSKASELQQMFSYDSEPYKKLQDIKNSQVGVKVLIKIENE